MEQPYEKEYVSFVLDIKACFFAHSPNSSFISFSSSLFISTKCAPILKKGNPQSDTNKRDTEIIPWGTDFAEYMQKNVLPERRAVLNDCHSARVF